MITAGWSARVTALLGYPFTLPLSRPSTDSDLDADRSHGLARRQPFCLTPERGSIGLARGQQRQCVEHDDALRDLEPREPARLEPLTACCDVEGCPLDAHHERAHPFAEAGVGLADRHSLAHRRVSLENGL